MSEQALLSLQNIIVKREENIILNGASLVVQPGEFVYLIGRVGSGKSTLLKSIYADLPISEGEGRFGDFDLKHIKRKQIPFLRRELGIIFQDFQLLTDRSVVKNLEFVLRATGWKDKKLIQKRISEVLEQVGLESKGYKMPHDEPTGNLDPITGEQIITLLREIGDAGTSILMSTHNYALVKKFPARIVKVEGGKLQEMQLKQDL